MLTQEIINDLDPGIRSFVVWLNEIGFETTDSGDGISKIKKYGEDPSILNYPHVFIRLDDMGAGPVKVICDDLCDFFEDEVNHKNWNVEISYDGKDKIWILIIAGILDESLCFFQKQKVQDEIFERLRKNDKSDGSDLNFLEMRLKKLQELEMEEIKNRLMVVKFHLDFEKQNENKIKE